MLYECPLLVAAAVTPDAVHNLVLYITVALRAGSNHAVQLL
jgi:hypothetical protein